MCCLNSRSPIYANNSVEASVFNIEKPGLILSGFSGQSFSYLVFFPEFVTLNKLFYQFWLFKKLKLTRQIAPQFIPAIKINFVVVSIHAP